MLQIQDMTFRIAGKPLFEGASAAVSQGQRVALVGRNGTGKSTLLKLIQGRLSPDAGSIYLSPKVRIGSVAQEVPSSGMSLLDTVLEADTERTALLAEAETAEDPQRIADIHMRLVDIDAHAAPARAARILSGLGFSAEDQKRPCRDFSGGWRMRVALAAVLFSRPDLLLLDEPTNHLDLEASLWLENYLCSWPGTMLLVSHDRDLLNAVPTGVLHLDRGKLLSYSGNLDQFLEVRRLKMENLAAQAGKQEAARKHMQAFIDRFRSKASKARQAQSRIKALEKMGPVMQIVEDAPARLSFPSPDPLPPPLITMDQAATGYGDHVVLRNLNLRIDPDDRIALLGSNGNGKSTLVKLLAGRLDPLSGEIRRAPKIKAGYFAQHQADEFDLSKTVLEEARYRMPKATPEQIRAHLGRFSFSGDHVKTPVGQLSGGEKARLLLAFMARESPNLLLLDEPTNHLDIDMREALVEALNNFEGAVILITHDPHLVELAADRLLLVDRGTCQTFDGDMDDYRRLVLDRAREKKQASPGIKEKTRTESQTARRKKLEDVEKRIETLTRQAETLRQKLADPSLYAGPATEVTRIQASLKETERTLQAAEEEWMVLHQDQDKPL
ncbi:MAG: ABC-F family ATP-binding cassette domain-containing protein [Pseudomonadota bacterium]|nr:ABC-F family ATP-binding cassette domain-containing protein [Pseudomonadota bacterium]